MKIEAQGKGVGSEPLTHQLGGLGERCKPPQRGPGQSPDRKRIFGRERKPENVSSTAQISWAWGARTQSQCTPCTLYISLTTATVRLKGLNPTQMNKGDDSYRV